MGHFSAILSLSGTSERNRGRSLACIAATDADALQTRSTLVPM